MPPGFNLAAFYFQAEYRRAWFATMAVAAMKALGFHEIRGKFLHTIGKKVQPECH